jgi:hypothetical protein
MEQWLEGWTMETVYLGCAVAGGAVLLLQTLLLLFGGGDTDALPDADVDLASDGHAPGAFGFLSVRAVASFLTFFGLGGWGGIEAGWGTFPTMAFASGAGLAMLFVVGALFSLYRRVDSQGNLDPRNAIGSSAQVYLRIPGANAGKGKVTVSIQGRSAQYAAVTRGDEIATGAEVRIVRMTTPDTFEVELLA